MEQQESQGLWRAAHCFRPYAATPKRLEEVVSRDQVIKGLGVRLKLIGTVPIETVIWSLVDVFWP